MKVVPSVLVSSMSGSSGGVVAASWKGIQYMRARVTPANPKTDLQVAQRLAFSRCVELWQELAAVPKAMWKAFVKGRALSGFNGFMHGNVADEKVDSAVEMTPVNSLCEAPLNVVISTGTASGEIDIDWDQGDATGTDQVCIWYRLAADTDLTYDEPAAVTIADETYTITGLTPATLYAVSMAGKDGDDEYSQADGDEATSQT